MTEGGFEPHVIVLSNVVLGFNLTRRETLWNWDLREAGVLDELIEYVKEKHAGVIATHGTISDWMVWLDCDSHYKVGCRGHVGSSLLDINPVSEKTIAALLGIPQLALWEYVRDKIAYALCSYEETMVYGALLGSIPLQIPYVPFNGSMKITPEAKVLGWKLPEEFRIEIPGIHEKFKVSAYTHVGWQLALPRALAYAAWWKAKEYGPIADRLYAKLSKLIEKITGGAYRAEHVRVHVDSALKWGLHHLYKSIISTNITGTKVTLTISIPTLKRNVTFTIDIGKGLEFLLKLMPVKLIAVSKDGLAGIIAHDKYWDPEGYRAVYFSFEVEACKNDIAEKLLTQAVEWTRRWRHVEVTELLGKLVRVTKEYAERFREKAKELAGTEILSQGLLLVEEGYSFVNISVPSPTILHVLIAHPTSDKVGVLVKGEAEIISLTTTDRMTEVSIEVKKAGTVTIGLRCFSELSLNPAYVIVKVRVKVPPSLETEEITISPKEIKVGEKVRIIIKVRNPSEETISQTIVLKINGTIEATKDIILAGGAIETISFEVIKEAPGIYIVEVNGKRGTFIVRRLRPADVCIEKLEIIPREIRVGEGVKITVYVVNRGEETGTRTIELKVNGKVIKAETVTLAGGKATSISFTLSFEKSGTYDIEVDGLKDTLIVKEAPPSAVPPEVSLYAFLAIAITITMIAVVVLIRRRRS
ncbi:MAG: hypothetical protein DRN15_06255 [Thermoprotei archaeon]|nr:MAG: hypothetical protein DRM97_05755 [Thermoprotei archaeon]RLF23420.1 MAG: hypothetical protein DRN15_06255 [Thermoprotei archaeon]